MKSRAMRNRFLFPFKGSVEITEKLLQFVWQSQLFSKGDLRTTGGEKIEIESSGMLNRNQGPDFLNARVRIAGVTLAGSIELHIRSSQWEVHGHSNDRNYDNVILHVVWDEDRKGGEDLSFPVLELNGRIAGVLIEHYHNLMQSPFSIACGRGISSLGPLSERAWHDRLLIERLEGIASRLIQLLNHHSFHWEKVLWITLCGNIGGRVNREAFQTIALSVPYNLLLRLSHHHNQIEALLMGQGSLLECEDHDVYLEMLRSEFSFLCKKYQLQSPGVALHFLRMRPMNFPTIRMAQLSALVPRLQLFFPMLLNDTEPHVLRQQLSVVPSTYWETHFRFGRRSQKLIKPIGEEMINNIFINTMIPLLFAYGQYHNQPVLQERAVRWLEQLPAEKNHIIRDFATLGLQCNSAAGSQAILELSAKYCEEKRCLECAIGKRLLNTTPETI